MQASSNQKDIKELLRRIRAAQNARNEPLELELLRQLAKLEGGNVNT